jgi:hypothetical protein
MNDDPCKEERERYIEARRKLIEVTEREPRMQRGETEIPLTDNVKNIQNLDFDLIERREKERKKAQQEKDKAEKEWDKCEKKHGNRGRINT